MKNLREIITQINSLKGNTEGNYDQLQKNIKQMVGKHIIFSAKRYSEQDLQTEKVRLRGKVIGTMGAIFIRVLDDDTGKSSTYNIMGMPIHNIYDESDTDLLERSIDCEKPKPKQAVSKEKGITANVREAMDAGYYKTDEVLYWLNGHDLRYKRASVRRIVRAERKKRGLQPQTKKPKIKPIGRCKGITANVRKAMDDGMLTAKDVIKYFDWEGLQYNYDSVYRVVSKERKDRGLLTQTEERLKLKQKYTQP